MKAVGCARALLIQADTGRQPSWHRKIKRHAPSHHAVLCATIGERDRLRQTTIKRCDEVLLNGAKAIRNVAAVLRQNFYASFKGDEQGSEVNGGRFGGGVASGRPSGLRAEERWCWRCERQDDFATERVSRSEMRRRETEVIETREPMKRV